MATGDIIDHSDYAEDEIIQGAENDDTLIGGSGKNILLGYGGNDSLEGGAGDDSIDGGAGNDSLYGGDGDDTLVNLSGDATMTGGEGNDLFDIQGGNVLIDDYSNGENDSDTVKIAGLTGTSLANGEQDIVFSYMGDDETGYTVTLQGATAKTLNLKTDVGSYAMSQNALTANPGFGGTLDARTHLSAITAVNASATARAVTLIGNDNANTLTGGAASDKLYGYAGNDKLLGGAGNDYLDGGDGNDTLTGGAGNDTFVYKASTGKDTIADYAAGDLLSVTGGAVSKAAVSGSDVVFTVGSGTVTLKNAAAKTVSTKDSRGSYTMSKTGLTLSSNFTGTMGAAQYLSTVSAINGKNAAKALSITGNGKANTITGGKAADFLDGGAGNDTLTGGAGKDTFAYKASTGKDVVTDYAAGQDTLYISSGTISKTTLANKNKDMVFTVGNGTVTLKNAGPKSIALKDSRGNYTMTKTALSLSSNFKGALNAANYLATITSINGSGAANAVTLYGNAKNNTINGGKAADKLYGRAGNDKIYGNAGNDYLYGEAGNDTLSGGAGNDNLRGGAGNDTLTGGAGNDTFTYANGEGKDVVADYTAGQDTLYITSNAISKTALSGKNVVFTVGKGSVTLSNAKGKTISLKDSRGGYSLSSSAITLASDFGGTMDVAKYWSTVRTVDGSKTTKTATLTGNAAANTLKGGSGANTLNGGAGNDKLYGYAGNDKLLGGAGNDSLDGGVGNDTLTGGAGNDTFVYAYDKGNDVIADYEQGKDKLLITGATSVPAEIGPVYSTKQSGKDVVFRFSACTATVKNGAGKTITLQDNRGGYTMSPTTLTLDANFSGRMNTDRYLSTIKTVDGRKTKNAVQLYGNSQSNVIYGGTGSDFISGEAGNDKIYGGAGNDSLIGGDGADYLDGGAGNDTISAGSGNDTLYGGAGSDYLYAGDGNDSVDGGDGNDMIYGREGNDTITGGKGKDTFVYYTGCGNDLIKDYAQGEDTLYITEGSVSAAAVSGNNLVLTIGGGKVTLANAAAKTVTVKTGGGTYTMNKTSLTAQAGFGGTLSAKAHLSTVKTVDGRAATGAADIYGNSIANVLYAGKAGGTLRGYAGNDTLYGGAGADVFQYDSGDDTIYNYQEGTDKIGVGAAAVKSAAVSGSDLILKTANGGKITVKGAAAKTVILMDANGVETDFKYDPDQSASQLSVIQNFMTYLDETDGVSAEELVNGAVNYASNGLFTTWDNLVNSFADDIAAHAGTKLESLYYLNGNLIIEDAVEKFLTDYCGINLRNTDTGAITGTDAGGATVKTPESIVPENGTVADVQSPQGASTTINGLTFLWPEGELNEIQQAIVNRIYTWWAQGALDLIEESYGLSFREEGATVNKITVQFGSRSDNTLAWVTHSKVVGGPNSGTCAGLTLTVNMDYFNSINLEDVNGDAGGTAGYLDRVLAHELTHAVMAANIKYFSDLPAAVKEGLAELVHGIDDTRTQTINQYAQTANAEALRNKLKLTIASADSYAGGYMLFRYFAKQVADNALGAMTTGSSGMMANSAPIIGSPAAQLASLVSTTRTGSLGELANTGLASTEATGSSLIAASGGASNPLANQKTA